MIYPGQAYTIDFLFSSYPTDPTGPLSAVGVWSSRDEKGGTQSITIAGGRSGTFAVSYGAACTVSGTTTFGDNNSNAFQVATHGFCDWKRLQVRHREHVWSTPDIRSWHKESEHRRALGAKRPERGLHVLKLPMQRWEHANRRSCVPVLRQPIQDPLGATNT